jgi:hypothetical protein
MSANIMPDQIRITSKEAAEIRSMKYECDFPWWAKYYCLDCGKLLNKEHTQTPKSGHHDNQGSIR